MLFLVINRVRIQQVGSTFIVNISYNLFFDYVYFYVEMEPRRTRSSYLSPPKSSRNTRMVKSTRVPVHELAKLKASKPMLVIPQPVLRIHECLDENVRMAQVESNAYIALGIKEEPIDEEYDDEGRYYEEADFTPMGSFTENFNDQDSFLEDTEENNERRTTRASKRRRLEGLDHNINNEDGNNNSKKPNKKRSSKGKNSNQEFRPIVLSVQSLAPTENQTPMSDHSDAILTSAQTDQQPDSLVEGNNNIENVVAPSKNGVPDPKLLNDSRQENATLQELVNDSSDQVNATKSPNRENSEVNSNVSHSPAKGLRHKTTKLAVETEIEPALPEEAAQNPVLSNDVENDEDEEDDHDADEEQSDVDFQATSSSSSTEEEESEVETAVETRKLLLCIPIKLN